MQILDFVLVLKNAILLEVKIRLILKMQGILVFWGPRITRIARMDWVSGLALRQALVHRRVKFGILRIGERAVTKRNF